jgi:glycosyltransferase involved in cell wall biosynthesis
MLKWCSGIGQANRARRGLAQWADQAVARSVRLVGGGGLSVPFDGDPRFALLTVNFYTTHYLKLMLRSLVEQEGVDRLSAVVICDNHSRDGGAPFLRELALRAGRVVLVENGWWRNHARGMRVALRALDRRDRNIESSQRANVLLFVDPDVLFLRHDALSALAGLFAPGSTAFAGELRRGLFPLPEAQASFLAVRRDWAVRRDVSPWVNHGSPAYWLQRDIWLRGGQGVDFRSNERGYALHRGRTAVAAARDFEPWSAYATVANRDPHYMSLPHGRKVWEFHEAAYSPWLTEDAEPGLLRLLAERLS